jgi:formate C-acetyltransferase
MGISDILIASIKEDTKRYIAWLDKIELFVDKDFILAGPFVTPEYEIWPRYHDNFHFPLGMGKVLNLGFSGIRDTALKNTANFNGNQREYLLLIHQVYKSISDLIARFASVAKDKRLDNVYKVCNNLTISPPQTFVEACQAYWFSAILRVGTSTIGRIDQHLYPFYAADLKKGLITLEGTRGLLSELLYRFEKRGAGKGDTLQNVTLGGSSFAGEDQTNELTYLILELAIKERYIEPKINVRVHKNSSERLWDLISELQISGRGICTVFNDDVISSGMMGYGRPREVAYNYCNDGCSEIILDGFGETWFRYIDCVKAVEHTLFNGEENMPEQSKLQYYSSTGDYIEAKSPVQRGQKTGDFLSMEDFSDFYRAYLKQLKYQIEVVLSEPFNSDKYPMRLFTAATMPDVLEKAQEPYTNSSCYHTYGLFIGSLGTAVNSLAAIKYLVYEQKTLDKGDLLAALRDNFKNYPVIQGLCQQAPKFGNDDDYVDKMAVDIAREFASWLREYKDGTGRPVIPGLYNHLFHHTAYSVGATPDGRSFGSPVGEHISPTPGTALHGPTAVINSVCKINIREQSFGSTVHLNIPLVSLKGTDSPRDVLINLAKVFCLKGGCVLNVNVLDYQKLLEAQKHPDKYKDLVVRVWGFSYYFVNLSKEMQDHVIARAREL